MDENIISIERAKKLSLRDATIASWQSERGSKER
jgi:hypothetical protein